MQDGASSSCISSIGYRLGPLFLRRPEGWFSSASSGLVLEAPLLACSLGDLLGGEFLGTGEGESEGEVGFMVDALVGD